MEQPEFITSNKPSNPGLDFEHLKSEGIQYIQELTGAFWTDYNEHDPGVTILEQLCYAITDLAFRVDFPIEDHLHNNQQPNKTFHKPDHILPCNALNTKDYRKLIIDSVKEIKNVWLFPTEGHENTLSGLYNIYMNIEENVEKEEKREKIRQEVIEVFCEHRNMGEDVEEVIILEPLVISVYANIEIENIEEIELILANINHRIKEFLNPEIHFYSLQELKNQSYNLENIYEGPLLAHGFIRDEDLLPKLDKIVVSEIIKIIMEVDGVISVKSLYLKVDDEIYDNQLIIPKHCLPQLNLVLNSRSESDKHDEYTINFYKGNVNYDLVDSIIFDRKLNELQASNKRVYRRHEEFVQIPKGRSINIEEYYSIQNQFPLVYGVGEYGIPDKPSHERRGQAKQLKGYLLLFEQILANFLSQLAHTKDLFSLQNLAEQTYFYQSLDNVPHIQDLYKNQSDNWVEDILLGENAIPEDYYLGLETLIQQRDNFTDRRNRLLDFLLAIHGEAYGEYSMFHKNYYSDHQTFEKHIIQNKNYLLRYLPRLNHNKARAFNYLKESIGNENVSGLEAKISILLGLNFTHNSNNGAEFKKKLIYDSLESSGPRKMKIIKEEDFGLHHETWHKETNLEAIGLSAEQVKEDFDYIDEEDILHFTKKGSMEKEVFFENTLIFKIGIISCNFLREGLNPSNYLIGTLAGSDSPHYIIFKYPNQEKWIYVADYQDYAQAHLGVHKLIQFLKDLNVQNEGFFLLEHLLLRPQTGAKKFGFYLLDENGENFLRTTQRYTFQERTKLIEEVEEHLYTYDNYSVERRKDGDFEIYFQTTDAKIQFVSLKAYESVQEIHEKMDRVYNFLADKDAKTPYKDKTALYIQSEDEERPIPEDFFAHRVTAALPNWTARFSNTDFRLVIEEMINETKPANIAAEILWLDIQEMKRFESLYEDWAEEKRKNGRKNPERLGKLANHFTQYILQLQDHRAKE